MPVYADCVLMFSWLKSSKRGLGFRKDPEDPRDRPLGALLRGATPPTSADLSHAVVGVLDQGATSSCVGNAWAQAIRIAQILDGVIDTRLPSRLAAYYWARCEHGDENVDFGTYLRACAKALSRFGLPPEDVWPFDTAKVNKAPPFKVYRAGYDMRGIRGYYRCSTLDDIRIALASNKPVVFGMTVGASFLNTNGPRTIDVDTGGDVGGHAMTVVGFEPGRFRIVNSWGNEWRDRGFAWLTDRRMSEASDCWAVDVHPEVTA